MTDTQEDAVAMPTMFGGNATKAKDALRIAEAYARLLKNPDFQEVVMQEYLVNHAASCVHGLSRATTNDTSLLRMQNELMGVSVVRDWLMTLPAIARHAKEELEAIRQQSALQHEMYKESKLEEEAEQANGDDDTGATELNDNEA